MNASAHSWRASYAASYAACKSAALSRFGVSQSRATLQAPSRIVLLFLAASRHNQAANTRPTRTTMRRILVDYDHPTTHPKFVGFEFTNQAPRFSTIVNREFDSPLTTATQSHVDDIPHVEHSTYRPRLPRLPPSLTCFLEAENATSVCRLHPSTFCSARRPVAGIVASIGRRFPIENAPRFRAKHGLSRTVLRHCEVLASASPSVSAHPRPFQHRHVLSPRKKVWD